MCIELGVLVEDSDVVTLSPTGPLVHTVHCILDVPGCVASPFEVVLPRPNGDGSFVRGWRLSDTAKQQVITLANNEATCNTCSPGGPIEQGFHFGMRGIIRDMGDMGAPPTIDLITGWSAAGALKTSDPNVTSTLLCVGGSDYPPDQLTDFPTKAPTSVPTSQPTTAPALDAFSTSVQAHPDVKVDFEVIPEEGAVEVTVTYAGTAWVSVAAAPDGIMFGSTACIAWEGNPPALYTMSDVSPNPRSQGIVLAPTQNLISSSFVQQDGESILKCKIPANLESGFAFSTTEPSPYILGWGTSSDFGYHTPDNKVGKLMVPALQPPPLSAFETSVQAHSDVNVDFVVIPEERAVEIVVTRVGGTGWLSVAASPNGGMTGATACIGTVSGATPVLYDIKEATPRGAGVLVSATQNMITASFTEADNVSVLMCKIPLDLETGFAFSTTTDTTFIVAWGNDSTLGYHGPNNKVANLVAPALQPPILVAFQSTIQADPALTVEFVVDPEDSSIEMTATLAGTGWVSVGPSPGGLMFGATVCVGDDPATAPQLYDLNEASPRGGGVVVSATQNLISSSFTQANGESVLKCKIQANLASGFAFSTFKETTFIAAWGNDNNFGYHGADNRVANLVAPALQPSEAVVPVDPPPTGSVQTLESGLTLEITDNGDQTATFVLTYEGEGWLSLAVSSDGKMIGSQAVIGLPDSGEDPVIYDLNLKETPGVVPAQTQILASSSVTQENGSTVLTFTVPLETEGFLVSAEGNTGYLYAYGSSNTLAYHAARSAFSAPLAEEPPKLFAFETSVEVATGVTVDFVVDTEERSVEITATLAAEAWLSVAASPDGRMFGATACIAKGDGVPPKLYDMNDVSPNPRGQGIVESATQNLISSSFTQEGGQSILKCKIPLDLESGFAFSSTKESPFIVAWGTDNTFGYHANNREPNLFVPALQPSGDFGVGDTICVEGYLMDSLCIDLGTLVDNPTVATLSVAQEGPIVHSVKCIVNVPACLESPFHIVPLAEGNDEYFDQGWRLDDAAKDIAVQAAYTHGSCAENCEGDQETGLYLSMQATVLSLGSNSEPGVITTTAMERASPEDNVCPFIARPPFPVPRVGDEVCVEGFVMDFFCIGLGVLFDNRSIETLSAQGPLAHSVHCLIDVSDCVASPFEILLPNLDDEGDDFIRAWRLDEDTKAEVVALAKAEGICTDCDGNGTIERGFHVRFTGRVVDVGTTDTPPTITGVTAVAATSPDELGCEGGSARPAPFVDLPDDTPKDDGPITLESGLTLEITDNGDQTATYVLTYEGEAWISLGVSPGGQMVGSQAVIGLPDSGTDPEIYNLNAKSDAGVVPADADSQVLASSSVTQEGGTTVLTFTVPLETDGFRVSAEDQTSYIYAYGSANTLAYHAARNAFSASVGGGVSLADDPENYYRAHGILMALAWGILCPLAIGVSLCRDFLPPGMFFQFHRAINSAVVLLTLIAFAIAVRATNIENLDHFTEVRHRPLGLVIFLFAFGQAVNGALRPHLPHKPEDDEDAELPPKSTARKVWEVAHRTIGFIILILAWVNCSSGIEQYALKFGADRSKWTAVFWTITGIIAGAVFLSFAGVKLTNKGDQNEPQQGQSKTKRDGQEA